MKFLLWIYGLVVIFLCFSTFSVQGAAVPAQNQTVVNKTLKIEQKHKKDGWKERMRQRIYKLIKVHDTFLIGFLICLFLLALAFMLGVYWVKNPEFLNALNYVSLGLVVITAIFAILWLMTVNMRKHP
ncbi:MAG: hypothetical protein NZ519_04915 [Bacteroidia bacterium]|nr:hypothetical protein [Bacteroidia bacterium]MDW8301094.1 hypothetical protein [Bacteroidia bacterium]